ncbi:helix-turn-helix transcriptional regulator [Streptomyces sp. SID3343]|uniref:helix-turn-helix domain-containing protein n=1 Tax=Streptomyces sp. SID3343 TaxID=2690260 RepID=UPI0031F91358
MAVEMDAGDSFAALFGKRVARQRKHLGITQAQLADLLCVSPSRISQFERALSYPPTAEQARLLDEHLQADGLFVDLWTYLNREGFPDWSKAFMALSERACHIREYTAHLVPGLLQTEDYARAILRTARSLTGEDHLAQRLAARMDRQKRLYADPPRLWVVLDEAVLWRAVGGRDVMRRQLRHLVDVSERPGITLQVLCFEQGAHEAMGGSLTVLTSPDESEAAYTEGADYGRLFEDPHDVAEYGMAYARLAGQALPADLSAEMIRTIAEDV